MAASSSRTSEVSLFVFWPFVLEGLCNLLLYSILQVMDAFLCCEGFLYSSLILPVVILWIVCSLVKKLALPTVELIKGLFDHSIFSSS